MREVSERRHINIIQCERTAHIHVPIDDGIRAQWLCEEPRVRRRELGKGCKGRRRLG